MYRCNAQKLHVFVMISVDFDILPNQISKHLIYNQIRMKDPSFITSHHTQGRSNKHLTPIWNKKDKIFINLTSNARGIEES